MTSSFEIWVETNRQLLGRDVTGLFKDSIKCLKNGICRPAYLLAYQGMLLAIRNVIAEGKTPDGFLEREWAAKLAGLNPDPNQNKKSWDEETIILIKTVENPPKAAPLHMPAHVRGQFEYWRILRNACAHYKADTLIEANVLSLYNFIGQWLLKISVTGGMEQMLDKIKDYCDPSKTSASAPIADLIALIPKLVPSEDLNPFIDRALRIFSDSRTRDNLDLICEILRSDSRFSELKDLTIAYVQPRISLLTGVLAKYPEMVLVLVTETNIRSFWYERMDFIRWHDFKHLHYLLKAGRIPQEELTELFDAMLDAQYKNHSGLYTDDADFISTLKNLGYYDRFADTYITEYYMDNSNKYSEVSFTTDVFISNLYHIDITEANLRKLVALLPTRVGSPYKLFDRFVEDLCTDEKFAKAIKAASEQYGIALPESWGI